MRTNDQESVFAGKEPRINPIAFYFAIQLLPYLVFVLFLIFNIPILQITIIILILLGINFWFIKNVNGIQLVGLRWKFSIITGFEYYSKPNPFVPRALDSNSFWIGFFIFLFLWIIALVISLFLKTPLLCLVCFIGFLSELINLMMFMRSHKSAKSQAEHAALEILQDETVNFEFVHSDDEENHKEKDGNEPLEANISDKSNSANDNHDFYSNETQDENLNENNKDANAYENNNDNGEFNLPTFDIPDENEANNNDDEPVHFELVDEKDD